MRFDLFLFGGGDADLLSEEVLAEDGDVLAEDGGVLPGDGDVLAEDGEVLSGDEVVLAEAVGGGLGGHVGGTEYLPPRRLCLLISSRKDIVE